jgi:hypothetical protein
MNDTPTPRTNALLGKILYDCGVLDEDTAPEEWVQLARQLESELVDWMQHAKDEVIRVSRVCRLLKLENDIYRNAIEQAIVELCPRARPSQARRILRIGLGQDPNQIYNAEPDSSGNSHAHPPEAG